MNATDCTEFFLKQRALAYLANFGTELEILKFANVSGKKTFPFQIKDKIITNSMNHITKEEENRQIV